jgi:hypothetical protein
MARDFTLTDRAAAVKAAPDEDREPCAACTFLLVDVSSTHRRWRCEVCLRTIVASILPDNEISFRDRRAHPRVVPADQEKLF